MLERSTPPETIQSNRLTLCKHDLDLAERMFACVDRDRERLARFLPWVDHVQTVEDERTYILSSHADWEATRMFNFGIFLRGEDNYVGNVGVHNISWAHARCEIGYWLVGTSEGQGIMTEAVSALQSALFALGMHRIEIRCSSLNYRSAGVPQRLGYRLEGTLQDWLFEGGAFRDVRIYGLLRAGAAP